MSKAQTGGIGRRAFTLIELLVVLIIIAILIAIIVPALGGVRNTARKSSTQQIMAQISNAASAFQKDQNRLPGYFGAREMASQENVDRGLSALQNVMLELAGGENAITPGTTGAPPGAITIGPGTTPQMQAHVNLDLLGTTSSGGGKSYYNPDAKHYVPQTEGNQQVASVMAHKQLPSIIDDFGNPILAWAADDGAPAQITPGTPRYAKFAKAQLSNPTTEASSRFYWAPNACFLKSDQLGRRAYNQIDPVSGSFIGAASAPADADKSLAGILGHPSYPYKDPSTGTLQIPDALPTAARGAFVLHSASVDGIFVGRRDRGGKLFGNGYVDYTINLVPNPTMPPGANNQYVDRDGKPTSIDLMDRFDDILVVGGN
jgi:prepilin-type N-terminal cleavage/methylation domain-containing protein